MSSERVQEAIESAERLEAAIRLAHGLLKDIKRERQALEQLISGARSLLNDEVEERVQQKMAEEINDQISELGNILNVQAHEIYDRVIEGVTTLTNNAIFGNDEGSGESIFEQARGKGFFDKADAARVSRRAKRLKGEQ